jgi:hypothetical protein
MEQAEGEPILASALWQDGPTEVPRQTIVITCKVECLICNAPLVSAERTITSVSDHELLARVA